jgi:hypothetical protein
MISRLAAAEEIGIEISQKDGKYSPERKKD